MKPPPCHVSIEREISEVLLSWCAKKISQSGFVAGAVATLLSILSHEVAVALGAGSALRLLSASVGVVPILLFLRKAHAPDRLDERDE